MERGKTMAKKTFSFTLEPKTVAQLREVAVKQNRTLSGLVQIFLDDHLDMMQVVESLDPEDWVKNIKSLLK
jgi:hypothetical protein